MKQRGKLLTIGAAAGIINGAFGAGGGMILVPLLCRWAKVPERKALATSVAVVLPMSAVSAAVYWLRGAATLSQALPYLIGGTVGGVIGGKLFPRLPAGILRRVLGALILLGGLRSVLG